MSVNITQFGAIGDGKTINTTMIQNAVDKCADTGGGDVIVPEGLFMTGTIQLKSNVCLYLSRGAVLKGSPDVEDYLPINLIRAERVNNVGIAGPGVINGNGWSFWERKAGFTNPKYGWYPAKQYIRKHKAPDVESRRPREMIKFIDCTNIRIEGTTFTDAPYWTFHILGCDEVIINGIRILNYMIGPNTDGIDMEATQNVIISNCYIYTGDDAVTMKNQIVGYSHRPVRNIVVTNCIIKTTCNGFKIGSGSNGDFENITFSNSVISAGRIGDEWTKDCEKTYGPEHYGNPLAPFAGIAFECVDGGNIRGITVTNIVMDDVRTPVFIRLGNRGGMYDKEKIMEPKPGTITDIQISNIVARNASTASSITAVPGAYIENVLLRDIIIRTRGGGDEELAKKNIPERESAYPEASMFGIIPVSGLFARHVKGLVADNLKIYLSETDKRPLIHFDDVLDFSVNNFNTDNLNMGKSIVLMENSAGCIHNASQYIPKNVPWFVIRGDLRRVQIENKNKNIIRYE
ncbi:MAG: glycosyl hydrolase family 28 protein [Bacteroidales bacterium]